MTASRSSVFFREGSVMTPLARRVLAVSASIGVVVAGAVVAPTAALAAPAPAPSPRLSSPRTTPSSTSPAMPR